MRTRKRPIDIVQILLKNIPLENRPPTNKPDEIDKRFDPSVDKIRTQLEEIKDRLIPQLNHYNDALVEELTQLETYIVDAKDIVDSEDQDEKIRQKIESIDATLEKIKKLKEKIPLTELDQEFGKEKQDLSKVEALQVSRDWLHLRVEQNILDSPAMANLQMSYDVLDIHLKICLLCLAIFPEKAVVKKKPLIYWWIGEGLISGSGNKSAEEVGEGVFVELIEKGLIQPIHKGKDKKSPIVDGCTMHPWIRRMLIAAARKAEFFDFDDAGKVVKKNVGDDSKSGRAFFVSDSGNTGDNNNGLNGDELFTIFNTNEHNLILETGLLSKIKKLVILQLGRWQISSEHHIEVADEVFLNELGAHKHLRYLSLQGISRITALPASIAKCINLEILDLRACHNLERLPSDLGSLRKLTHLDISQCYLLESMPKGIEKLSLLQVLKGFVIGDSKKSPCKLGDLVHLKKLRKLSIHIGSKAAINEGELNKLKEIASLRVLSISWGKVVVVPSKKGEQVGTETSSNVAGASSSSQQNEEGLKLTEAATLTMESFSFPPELEKLDLRCLPRKISPEWLKPSNFEKLKKLYIRGGELNDLKPKDDKKWKVMILRLKYLKNLKIKKELLQVYFPNLVYFEKIEPEIEPNQTGPNQIDVEWNYADGWETLSTL